MTFKRKGFYYDLAGNGYWTDDLHGKTVGDIGSNPELRTTSNEYYVLTDQGLTRDTNSHTEAHGR